MGALQNVQHLNVGNSPAALTIKLLQNFEEGIGAQPLKFTKLNPVLKIETLWFNGDSPYVPGLFS